MSADPPPVSFVDTNVPVYALVVVAASRSGARRLYSEDLQDGQGILGVEIVNPFRRASNGGRDAPGR